MSATTVNSNRSSTPVNNTPAAPAASGPTVPVANQSFGYSADSGFEASTEGTAPGGIDYSAQVSGPSIDVNGSASATVGRDGVDINVSVDVNATLAEAGAQGTKTFEVQVGDETVQVTVDLSAEGVVGADGQLNLNIHIGTDGKVSITAGASGFAGARASLTGGITVTHNGEELASGSVTLSATAGVGADAHANVEIDGSKVKFDVGAEATTVGGFGVDFDGDIDAKNTAFFLADVIKGYADDGVEWAEDALGDVGDWVGDRFEDVGDWINDQWDKLPWG